MQLLEPIKIPENVQLFLNSFYSVVELSINTTDAINGYGCIVTQVCRVKMYREKCRKCGFDGIFNMDERCKGRHAWDKDYVDVFVCSFNQSEDIEFSFDVFLDQPAFSVGTNEIDRVPGRPVKPYYRVKTLG